jgi:glycosyltransferase involved in cell wall biosynthesis
VDDPDLLRRLPVKMVLVPGDWYRRMFEPYYGEKVRAWPVGIDTDKWVPQDSEKIHDFLIYDKVRWEHERYEKELIEPIRTELRQRGLSFQEIRYGFYQEEEFHRKLAACRAMIFLCEHESQGIAYQQALACGVPILAWDRGGYWQDPTYYPTRAKFGPVTSVPYWDERCGVKFSGVEEFGARLEEFKAGLDAGRFAPRDYVLEHLELGSKAKEFVRIVERVACDET